MIRNVCKGSRYDFQEVIFDEEDATYFLQRCLSDRSVFVHIPLFLVRPSLLEERGVGGSGGGGRMRRL